MKLMIQPTFDSPGIPDISLLQKYTESNGSVVYLPSSTVKNLISLWDYTDILIKHNRPADQKYNKFYYVIYEQWLKLTANDMRSALVDMKLDKQSTYRTHASTSPMPHLNHTDPKISNRRDIQVTKIILPHHAQGLKPSKLSNPHNTQDFNHLHTYTQNYVSLHFIYMSTQKYATSTIRGE